MSINFQIIRNYLTLPTILVAFLISNIISCRCGNTQDEQGNENNYANTLSIKVNPADLSGNNKETTLTIELTENDKIADLSKLYISAKILKEEGGNGSQLSYQDILGSVQNLKEDNKTPLTQLTKFDSLKKNNPSFQIELNVIPVQKVTEVGYDLELIHEDGTVIDHCSISWKDVQQPALTFTLESAANMYGDDKEIKLKIGNPTPHTIAANTCMLKITREAGKKATIVGAVATDIVNIYEIGLEAIDVNVPLSKVLTIDSQGEREIAFSIQLFYQGKPQGDIVKVSWKQGIALKLDISHDTDSSMLSYNVENIGSEDVEELKLIYKSKAIGIKLNGNLLRKDVPKEIPIGDLGKAFKKENQLIGKLDFNTNMSAEFEFELVYKGGEY